MKSFNKSSKVKSKHEKSRMLKDEHDRLIRVRDEYDLSRRLSNSGDKEGALDAAYRAVDICKCLVEEDFSKHSYNFAVCLERLAFCYADNNDDASALSTWRRELDIREKLAERDFDANGRIYASCLGRVSDALAINSEFSEGLKISRCAVDVHGRLADKKYAALASGLSPSSLYNICLRSFTSINDLIGSYDELSQELKVFKKISSDDFINYCPDLASSLYRLSYFSHKCDDWLSAYNAALQAVNIYRELLEIDFSAYAHKLSTSIDGLLAVFRSSKSYGKNRSDRVGEISTRTLQVAVYQELVKERFDEYAQRLASSTNDLSLILSACGHYKKGLEMACRSVDVYEKLSVNDYSTHAMNLGVSLSNLSIRLWENEDLESALNMGERAVNILSRLVETNYSSYCSSYAFSLNNQSILIEKSGDRSRGINVIKQAIDIRKKLADEDILVNGEDLAVSVEQFLVFHLRANNKSEIIKAMYWAKKIVEPFAKSGNIHDLLLKKIKNELANKKSKN